MKNFNLWNIVPIFLIVMFIHNTFIDGGCAGEIEIGLAAMHVDGHLPSAGEIQIFENKFGKKLATVGWFMGIGEKKQEQSRIPLEMLMRDYKPSKEEARSLIPMVTLEPWGELKKNLEGNYEGPLHRINRGVLDGYFRQLASDIRLFDSPVRVRFAHEMIQNDVPEYSDPHPGWYPWQDEPQQYVMAFRRLVRIFREEKTDNVEFVWAPNFHMYDYTILEKYYPGQDYVDWIGLDGYNWSGHDFDGIFSYIYRAIVGHVDIFGDKPIMLSEFAMAENLSPKTSKGEWIKDAFLKMKTSYPKIRAFYWFQLNKEHDWRLDSSPESWQAFKEAMKDSSFISR